MDKYIYVGNVTFKTKRRKKNYFLLKYAAVCLHSFRCYHIHDNINISLACSVINSQIIERVTLDRIFKRNSIYSLITCKHSYTQIKQNNIRLTVSIS